MTRRQELTSRPFVLPKPAVAYYIVPMQLPLSLIATLIASTLAQSIDIDVPAAPLVPGSNVTISLFRPTPNGTTTEVAVTLSVVQCAGSDGTQCPDPSEELGTTLYEGPFHPVLVLTGPGPTNPTPRQSFEVTVPGALRSGTHAQIAAVHLSLVGVSAFPPSRPGRCNFELNLDWAGWTEAVLRGQERRGRCGVISPPAGLWAVWKAWWATAGRVRMFLFAPTKLLTYYGDNVVFPMPRVLCCERDTLKPYSCGRFRSARPAEGPPGTSSIILIRVPGSVVGVHTSSDLTRKSHMKL
ncbi:hypothetical protein OF83DRAFT_320133 [Amylostereum chailletii]|nr:hypothetical protein OF83DRAFT_320133 [Amylostereum chailletii]